jgi:hypothetical protein
MLSVPVQWPVTAADPGDALLFSSGAGVRSPSGKRQEEEDSVLFCGHGG